MRIECTESVVVNNHWQLYKAAANYRKIGVHLIRELYTVTLNMQCLIGVIVLCNKFQRDLHCKES